MILSVSRYTAKLEEQRLHDAQIPMHVETNSTPTVELVEEAEQPTSQLLNSDSEFK